MTTASSAAGPLYLDASALAKLYLPEPESGRLNRWLKGRRDLLVSDLAITEVVSALARRSREGHLSREAISRFHSKITAHIQSGVYERIDLLPATHRDAERLLTTLDAPLRAADAIHLAVAFAGRAASILTYNHRLAEAAALAGLAALPPFPG